MLDNEIMLRVQELVKERSLPLRINTESVQSAKVMLEQSKDWCANTNVCLMDLIVLQLDQMAVSLQECDYRTAQYACITAIAWLLREADVIDRKLNKSTASKAWSVYHKNYKAKKEREKRNGNG